MKDFKDDFKKVADYIIIDSAAGLGKEATSVLDVADELIIVTNPEIPAITDALKVLKIAEQMDKSIKGIIVTRVRKNRIEMQPDSVKEMLESPILGMVPEDITVQKSLGLKDAVVHTHPKSKVARAYKEIAAKLLDIEYDSYKDRERFLEILARKFGFRN
jgi:septum site-determining protein MinD